MKEIIGKDFANMEYNAQENIIKACLVNTAKMINDKQSGNDKATFTDCVKFLFENKAECFNETWLICAERVTDSKYNELPIALYVSKASGKALRKMFYWNAKSASEKVDTETMVNCSDCFDSFSDILAKDRIEKITEYIRNDIKENCLFVIDSIECGFSFSEIADMLNTSIKTIYKYVSAIANAIAIVNAMDKEWNIVESIIASDIALKDNVSKRQLESVIANIAKKEIPNYESIVKWNEFQTNRMQWLVAYLKSKSNN